MSTARKRPAKKPARKKAAARKRVTRKAKPRKVARSPKTRLRSISPPEHKMVTKLGEVDFEHRTVTNSMRSNFLNCRRKFLYGYGFGLVPRSSPHYFVLGGMTHDEWQRMYETGKFVRASALKRIDAKTKAALKEALGEEAEKKIWAANAVARGLIVGYADYYLEKDLEQWDILECEGSFDPIPIPGTEWTYRGRRDMVIALKDDDERTELPAGAVGLCENKTTAQLDANYIARLPLDHQTLGYIWSMQQEQALDTFGSPPSFIEYNPSKKSQLRQRQTETRGQYLDRVEADYLAEPQKYFYRERIRFSPRAVDAFVEELTAFVGELEDALAKDMFSMNTNQCTIRGVCEYMPLCIDGPRKDVLMQYRRKRFTHEELDDEEDG